MFFSNVVARFRQALLVDALSETFLLDKPAHCVEVDFIKGVLIGVVYYPRTKNMIPSTSVISSTSVKVRNW